MYFMHLYLMICFWKHKKMLQQDLLKHSGPVVKIMLNCKQNDSFCQLITMRQSYRNQHHSILLPVTKGTCVCHHCEFITIFSRAHQGSLISLNSVHILLQSTTNCLSGLLSDISTKMRVFCIGEHVII